MSDARIKQQLREWLAKKNGKIAVDQLTDTLPILEQRVLSSLHVAELLLYIAELRDRPIDVESLKPGIFRDIDTIYRTFFPGGGDGDPALHPHVAMYPNGQVALTGEMLLLDQQLDAALVGFARARAAIEHRFPPIIPAAELDKIDYLGSFPHLATFPVVLAPDDANVAGFAANRGSPDNLHLAKLAPVCDLLAPAACYHFYIHYQNRSLAASLYLSTRATCFRREDRYVALERLWSFSMRELVCIGTADEVKAFLDAEREVVGGFARRLGLPVEWVHATDPFFRPAQHPKHLAQRLDPVKHELVFDGRLAIASVNYHRSYFGEAFAIERAGEPACSGCVAFGIERWLSAIVSTHGHDPASWPAELRR